MTGAIAPLTDFGIWARGDLLVIILLILGATLLTRFADWARGRIVDHIDARFSVSDELVRSEAARHRHVVASVLTWCVLAIIYVATAVLIVQRLGVPQSVTQTGASQTSTPATTPATTQSPPATSPAPTLSTPAPTPS